ncbi:dihydrolipoamide acetyltransferase family protein [Pseudobacteriovorax antillogorgiicola]|uniref:Dihydrolipoamide acetyltransferase component of pyruvate dehydrogenase complex n=1 Tax=Pseudobacteriovorax antillogorgiicola TaxID=1513793 RepID=A0A1Y6BB55_9BACT|nr:dihydrolipoamide acetyltransferase family protein [Pseudobacteriovorax antillogorgiicola]TCS58824.1 2-oxoglutarate dehydrogenase E2 component (dihydrolipoamide succinyltransferase) [Pseudobacteriovorax antillogorgiicola]SME94242.1 2-oxoglutarate dehydrogenase E2 component (dihydrolipoamide succinyltransferase) [Pseudobacteriovorax antillogorgiicola]
MATTEVLLPLMGEGVNEATVSSWLVQVGDRVQKDAPLLEVSTDKVDTEIPAPADGFLIQASVKEGDTVEVNQVLGIIADDRDESVRQSTGGQQAQAVTSSPTPSNVTASSNPAAATSADQSNIKSSPLVRKIAQEQGIDLAQVVGTGLHGRITKKDVLAHQEQQSAPAAVPTQKSSTPVPAAVPADTAMAHPGLSTSTDDQGREYLEGVEVQRQPMSRMRCLIADHMVESVRTSPHVTTVFEMDMHKVVRMREAYKDRFFKEEGFKLTYTPFLIHAAVEAVKKFPIVNSSLDGYDLLLKKDINIGCAVALDGGLIVPVIKKAGELSLLGIARRLNDLVVRARSKKLKPDEVQGGTFSITNPGGYGSLTSNPIINQPQVAILGVGTIVKRPVVVDDMIAIRPQMMASLTFDHRVIDGEVGAKYLAAMKEALENYDTPPL